MNAFDRRIQAAVASLFAEQPLEAEHEIQTIAPDLRERSEVLLVGYEISATRRDWSQARRFARILRRRHRHRPDMVLLLTEAMRNEAKPWEAGSMLRATENHFPDDIGLQHHLLRHEIESDAPEVALRRIERLLAKKPGWLAATLASLPASLRR